MAEDVDRFTRVEFKRFKAFENFRVDLRAFNVIVGPNNAGKSTIVGAFRILAEAMRRANNRKAQIISGPRGPVAGHSFDLKNAFVAEENIFFEYDDEEAASIEFFLDNGNSLLLYFPERETCYLIPNTQGKPCFAPAAFRKFFRCKIAFAPILSPVDHYEPPYKKEAARLALLNYLAARNFRNIWYHFPEKFPEFKRLVEETWPGMSIKMPEMAQREGKPYLFMYCPEDRKDREIFWAGFGFQVWCQMLTHIIQADDASVFLIDEPDVYLHSDLQRQLVSILKALGPDIIMATHSTEIIVECESEDIVLVAKEKRRAKRLRPPVEIGGVFALLGSAANPILTQLAKTRKVLFVEGLDFKLLSRFARKLGHKRVAARADFAVVATLGFNPEKVKSLKEGMEHPLGRSVLAGVILDRDYRSKEECDDISEGIGKVADFCAIHHCKEIENFTLVASAIDRLAKQKIRDKRARGSQVPEYECSARDMLNEFAESKRIYVMSQYTDAFKRYHRQSGSRVQETTLLQRAMEEFQARWQDEGERFRMIPGKDALSFINSKLQENFKVSLSATGIVDSMLRSEVPSEMEELIGQIGVFAEADPPV